jgi:translation initiation factor IF-2
LLLPQMMVFMPQTIEAINHAKAAEIEIIGSDQ